MKLAGRSLRKKFFSIAALGCLICLVPSAQAQNTAEKLVEKVKESKRGVIEAETEKRKVLGSLYTINQRMKKITSEKSHLTDELFQVQDNVNNISKVIAALEVQIEKQRHLLRRRLRALYKLSGEGYLAIIFSRSNAADLDESMRFLKIITDNDHQLIRNYQKNIQLYVAQKAKLRGQVQRLVAIEKNIKKKEGMLAAEHKAKSKLVSELDRARIASLNQLKKLRSKTQELAAEKENLSDLLKPSIFEQKGQLPHPVRGTVVQDFGLVRDDKFKTRLSHKGWRYESSAGETVSAIYEGRVVFSDWLQGYGHAVIVDHGDHYYSIYGHISRVRVKTGDTINQGQTLADVGPRSRNYSEGLYFELRHFSEPENPANWIQGAGGAKSSFAYNGTEKN